ncbi:phage tail protein [Deinococcus radiotolerans]|uniref:Tail Collar domain-containing protein n=1 Tax=Deinococcus radiotolerans TaxID=1309407 RepID=A0ABQ2FRD7_9DEIO|nr:tail fiber protein [Deinococcus radiotolerans]GGL19410.1 tail Collar domain-containing protein [Deinococcus radiotolerans]
MSDPYLSEIRLMSFAFAPKGWVECNGQLLSINQHQALFSLLGTLYGGDGRVTFALPNLQGRVPMHEGLGWSMGQVAGSPTVTLTQAQLPAHTHPAQGSSTASGTTTDPTGALLAPVNGGYRPGGDPLTPLDATSVTSVGGGQPHENMQPYLTLSFCMATEGAYPSPTDPAER